MKHHPGSNCVSRTNRRIKTPYVQLSAETLKGGLPEPGGIAALTGARRTYPHVCVALSPRSLRTTFKPRLSSLPTLKGWERFGHRAQPGWDGCRNGEGACGTPLVQELGNKRRHRRLAADRHVLIRVFHGKPMLRQGARLWC